MNKTTQEKIFKYLNKNGIENFIGVPDSTMKHFINYGLENNKIIITTKPCIRIEGTVSASTKNGLFDNIKISPLCSVVFSIDNIIDQLLYRGQFVTAF